MISYDNCYYYYLTTSRKQWGSSANTGVTSTETRTYTRIQFLGINKCHLYSIITIDSSHPNEIRHERISNGSQS